MEDERMPSLDPAAQSQVKSWRVRADEAGVAFFFTATPAFIILALAPASWQGLIFLVGFGCILAASVRGFRLSIDLGDEYVVVKNYWRTYRFSRDEVEESRPCAVTIGVLPRRALGFGLRSGRLVCAQGTAGGARDRHRALEMLRQAAAREGVSISPEFEGVPSHH
jgi:hypothetical protein